MDTRLYHGTSTQAAADSIIQSGFIKPPETVSKKMLAPVKGKVYITPDLSYALIYALGANMANHDMSQSLMGKDRYGYVFVIDAKSVKDVQPDEDSIGGFVMRHTKSRSQYGASSSVWSQIFDPDGTDDTDKKRVWEFLKRSMTEKQFQGAIDGYVTHQAQGGKRALQFMPDEFKLNLIKWGAHIAHDGILKPSECWQVDKTKSKEFKRDGSNFFDIATKVS